MKYLEIAYLQQKSGKACCAFPFLGFIYKEMVTVFAIFGKIFSGSTLESQGQNDGETSYIACLYRQYRVFLFQKAAHYTNSPHEREDIVQNTVLRLMRNEDKLRTLDPAALTAYIALTIRSAALNYLRDEHRDSLDALPLNEELEEECVPLDGRSQLTLEEQMLLGHRDDEVRAAVGRLSERDQAALVGKYFLELDNRELAKLLGITPDTLRTVLCRARSRALNELKKEGILHE